MKRRRVKITGIGIISPAGIGNEEFRKGILSGVSHVVPVTRFDPAAGPFVAAEVAGFSVADYVTESTARRLPRHTQFALGAAVLALRDAGLESVSMASGAPVVVLGSSLMGMDVVSRTITNVAVKGPSQALGRAVFQAPASSNAGALITHLGYGRALTVQTACCAGTDAIGAALALVADGESDFVICGGTEAPVLYCPMLELKSVGLAPNTDERPGQLARPFDLWRTTGVIGEGACVLILEPETSPRPGYAFLDGYSFANDHEDLGVCGGMDEAIRLCLANASLNASQIEHISAWGPGHRQIDAAETAALRRVFGDHLDSIPVASIKGAIGNPLGAAGAIQAGCAALGLRDSFIPPTVNWTTEDPSCRLNLSAAPRHLDHRTALVNAHGLSGTNSCLVLSRCT